MSIEKTVAKNLLDIKAVSLQPNDPFTWASGIKSPIYCDNRLVLSFPEKRSVVVQGFVELIQKEYSEAYLETLIVLDGTTGQNAMAQAKQFKEATDISGIILTKLDGTAKGGIAIAIQSELGIPVKYIGIGEQVDDLQRFDPDMFVNALFEKGEEN